MKGFSHNLQEATHSNDSFRKVLYTGAHTQLVLMTLQPGEDIGLEAHEGHDQFFRFEHGTGEAVVGEETYQVAAGSAIIVPSGAVHNVTNTSETEPLKLYTLYAPPEHQDGTEHATKADAEADDEHFDGTTTE
ncbi:MAG TPA: cupin domain-containing protein [Candidatus Paceibacterota bacterium]|nr:cupin domain-containing protein [Candidatus Paceibacterota bacterium]